MIDADGKWNFYNFIGFDFHPEQQVVDEEKYDMSIAFSSPIDSLYDVLNFRVINSLKRTGITTVADFLGMLDRGPDAMLAIRNFGEKSLDELVERLQEKGYLPPDKDVPFLDDNKGS